MDILVPTERTKMVATGHISLAKNIPKSFCGRSPDPDGQADTAALLRHPSWSWRPYMADWEWEVKKRERVEKKGDYGRLTEKDWRQAVGLVLASCS